MTVLQAILYAKSGGGFWTSLNFKHQEDAIAGWRRLLTEDPFATGLLDICFSESNPEVVANFAAGRRGLIVSAAARRGIPLLASVSDVHAEWDAAVSYRRVSSDRGDVCLDRWKDIEKDNPFAVVALVGDGIL